MPSTDNWLQRPFLMAGFHALYGQPACTPVTKNRLARASGGSVAPDAGSQAGVQGETAQGTSQLADKRNRES